MFPDFYYLYSKEDQTHSAMPTGEVDIDQIRQQDPKIWLSRNLHEELKPKTLIFNDIFFSYRSPEEQNQVKEKLSQLLDQKFPLFFWKKGELIALNHSNLSELVNAEADYPNIILNQAIKKPNLTKDNLLLLNDYWVNQLLSGKKELQKHALSANLWDKVRNSSRYILNHLALIEPKVTQYIYDVYPENERHKHPADMNFKVIRRYKVIKKRLEQSISEDMLDDDLEIDVDEISGDEVINLVKSIPRSSDKIKKFKLKDLTTALELKPLLDNLPNITTLELMFENMFNSFFPLKPESFNKLKIFKVNNSLITTTQLEQFLLAAPNLEALSLNFCKALTEEPLSSLKSGCLSKLKKLSLYSSSITSSQLEQLLLAAPNLEVLDLNYCQELTTEPLLLLKPGSLSKLKNLDLRLTSITISQLKQLLLAAPNLETLKLNMGKVLPTEQQLSLKSGYLSKLKDLDLSNTLVTVTQLEQFLLAAPNLQILSLNGCREFGEQPLSLLKSGCLSQLKSLNLAYSSINSRQLDQFLLAAPNLETINLADCKNLTEEPLRLLKSGGLSKLKSLNLNNSSITTTTLGQLLLAAPNLETLDLNECMTEELLPILKSGCLSKLKTLNLVSSSITAKQLEQLLVAAPNLETLNLYRCTNLTKELLPGLKSGCLSKLKTLNLVSSSITAKQLEQLLIAAPNLETINLNNCRQLNEESIARLKSGCLSKVTSFDLDYSSITTPQLEQLLLAAPNLETLKLGNCDKLTKDPLTLLTSGCLSKVKSLDSNSSILTATQLEQLLIAAPNIESLELVSCEAMRGLTQFKSIYLKKLQSLEFNRTPIQGKILYELLQGNSNLKNLTLEDCEELNKGTFGPLRKGSLDKLGSIRLSKSSITTAQLNNLLGAASNLETLQIRSCKERGHEPLALQPGSLPQLNSLSLFEFNSDISQLESFLLAAPNLKMLSIVRSKLSSEAFLLLKPNCLINLQNIDLYDTIITEEQLNQLKLAAPNAKIINAQPIKYALNTRNPKPILSDFIPTDPDFNPKEHLNSPQTKKPNDLSANNQGMIIAKLSHYLLTKDPQKNKDLVASLQDGICFPLSLYFINNPKVFSDFFEKIKNWDLKTSPSDKLCTHLDRLIHDFLPLQTQQGKRSYLGAEWLEQISTIKKPLLLGNPWHAIAIEPPTDSKGLWTVYDPNYVKGPKMVPKSALKSTISRALGNANIQILLGSLPSKPVTLAKNFFKEGGLLTLCSVENWQDIIAQLKNNLWSAEDLEDGLFLRNTSGVPAWFNGLNHAAPAIQNLTKTLLDLYKKQFLKNDEGLFKQKLRESIKDVNTQMMFSPTPDQITKPSDAKPDEPIKALLDVLKDDSKGGPNVVDKLATVIQTQTQDKAFETWCADYLKSQRIFKNDIKDLKLYGQEVFSLKGNTLISCKSDEDRLTLQLELYQQASRSGHPVYFIDSPEDLLCKANYLDAKGNLQKGPGGPLYDFLKANKDNNPTLLINYDSFKSSDFVRFNTLLDEEPSVDGVFFQDLFDDNAPNALEQGKTELRVVGFRNGANPNCYNESDFTSRMPNKRQAPQGLSTAPPLRTVLDKNPEEINLFHSPYWKSELLGQWVPTGNGFRFKEGLLEKALKKAPKELLIHNALETNSEYQAFWHKAQTLGFITHQGRTIVLPNDLKISHQTGYDWAAFKTQPVTCYRGIGQGEVINPTRFQSLFKRYHCQNNQLIKRDGLIKEAAKRPEKSLTLTISRGLSLNQWAKLFAKGAEAKVSLSLYLAKGVKPPPELALTIHRIKSKSSRQRDHVFPICSSVEAKKAVSDLNNPLVIDVSEAQASDLIKRLLLKDTSDLSMNFEERDGAVIEALQEKRTVVLKGQISDALMDELQAVLQERRANPKARGQLLVMPTTIVRQADLKRFEILSNIPPKNISAQAFIQGRIDACQAVLKDLPYVFLSGLSGVGKTTFVEKEFCEPKKHTLHKNMDEWLEAEPVDREGHYHFLFIDEANLSSRDFSEFEDLFNNPPTLMYKGKIYPLSPQHKVIFAGNPLSYGEGRKLATLFQEHRGEVVFDPLAYSVIEERILAPVFEGFSWAPEDRQFVQNHLLEVYKTLCGYSETNILISPRELQMMALLTTNYCQRFKADPKAVVQHYAYQLAAALVPDQYRSDFERFQPKKPLEHAIHPKVAPKESSFCVTATRKSLEQNVNKLFLLRQQRREKAETANEEQLYGGLGGLVLEGSPGVGKSMFLVHLLRSWDFEEVHELREDAPVGNYFYRIPANFSIKQKKEFLRQAFHEGAVVIMDEINSSPMMESFLNALLMGRDDAKLRPKNPGFILLGTQNPASFSGRLQASEALNRRLQKVDVPEYPLEELVQILVTKGVRKDKATIMGKQWQLAYNDAQSNHSTPPTFRDLMNMAKETPKTDRVEVINRVQPLPKPKLPPKPIEETQKSNRVEETLPKPKLPPIPPKPIEGMQHGLKVIQIHFNDQLESMYRQLKKHAAGDADQLKASSRLKQGLTRAQSKLFTNIKPDSSEHDIKKHIEEFSLSCSHHRKAADAVMGHGWLFRAVEVVAKAIAALFVGIGMVLGSIVLQGFAKESHRTWYSNTFFTLHQTEASKDLEALDKATLDLQSKLEGPKKGR